MSTTLIRVSFWLAVLVLLAACAARVPAPTEEMTVARTAVTYAEESGAREHAPVELRQAQEKLQQARLAYDAGDYERARHLAEQAETDARYADLRARTNRAQRSVDELQASLDSLRREIERDREELRYGGGS